MNKEALGVDIGNVIIDHRLISKEEAKLLEERYSTIPATDGVFDCLKKLNDERFHGNIFLISKCTPWAKEKVSAWFKDNDFYNKTGVKPENVFFCQERSEKEKICKENNITHFVDDRLEVLSYMIDKVPNLFLFKPNEKEVEEFKQFLPKVIMVESWGEVLNNIL